MQIFEALLFSSFLFNTLLHKFSVSQQPEVSSFRSAMPPYCLISYSNLPVRKCFWEKIRVIIVSLIYFPSGIIVCCPLSESSYILPSVQLLSHGQTQNQRSLITFSVGRCSIIFLHFSCPFTLLAGCQNRHESIVMHIIFHSTYKCSLRSFLLSFLVLPQF